MTIKAGILGTGYYLPPTILTNNELEKIIDTTDDWITSRTGIKERHIAVDETTSDLAAKAALKAISNAGLQPADIDCILLATITPDKPWPATACFVQQKLGLNHIPAMDISAACSGFVYGLQLARALIVAKTYKKILLIGVEKFSAYLDWQDRNTCVLFADGAGAVVIGQSEQSEIMGISLGTDGSKADILQTPGFGHINPLSPETAERKFCFMQMDGKDVYKNAVERMPQALDEALKQADKSINEMDYFIFHQANLRIIDFMARRYKLPKEKLIINIQNYGNTSAATIPIALAEAIENGVIKPGSLIGMSAFGAGTTWGGAVVRV